MLDHNFYKSPLKKLVVFFEKSRDGWKEKYLSSKNENRQLKKKLAILEESREKWKAEALLSRKQPKESELCNKITPPEPVKKKI
jgi:hypothetical protein